MSLLALAIVAAAAGMLGNPGKREKSSPDGPPEETAAAATGTECCGRHEICEKESLLAAISRRIEYYDDEELDRYIGVAPDRYTAQQEEEFRDVFYTMRSEDVAGWVRSLQLRGIALPDGLKDEVLLVVGERRGKAAGQ